MLGAAAIVALLGGWLIAWLVRDLGLPFRLTWTLASVLLFAIPGVSVLAREAGGWSRLTILGDPAPNREAEDEGQAEPGGGFEPNGAGGR